MKKLASLALGLLFIPILALPAHADVESCTAQIIKNDLDGGVFGYTGGNLVASESYQGMNYHLVFLVAGSAGGRESELVIRENSQICEKLLYNPTAEAVKYETLMPQTVAKKLDAKLREYSKALSERRIQQQRQLGF